MWCYFAFLIFFVIFHYIVLSPFIQLLLIKIKLGDKAVLYFKPLKGFMYYIINSQEQQNDALLFLKQLVKENQNAEVILANLGFKPLIIFLNPGDYKDIMTNPTYYTKLNFIADERIVQNGLLFSDGQMWKKQRYLMGQTFNYDELKKNVPLINKVINEKIVKLKSDNVEQITPNSFFEQIISEIIFRVFFGDDIKNMSFDGVPAIQYVLKIIYEQIDNIRYHPLFLFRYLLMGQWVWKILPLKREKGLYEESSVMLQNIKEYISKRLDEKKQKMQSQDKEEERDFLDLHLNYYLKQESKKENEKITLNEIIQQSLTMMTAGTDTTTTLLSTTLYFLIKYPKIQEELFDEIKTVIGDKTTIEHSDIKNLSLMSSFINECLRVKPVAFALLPRKAVKQHQIKGITIKKGYQINNFQYLGWFVNYQQVGTTENEKYFKNPQEFDFKRWLAGKGLKPEAENQNFAFTPFSAGPRNCIGQHLALIETKVILSQMIRNFVFYFDQRDPTWIVKLTYQVDEKYSIKIRGRK